MNTMQFKERAIDLKKKIEFAKSKNWLRLMSVYKNIEAKSLLKEEVRGCNKYIDGNNSCGGVNNKFCETCEKEYNEGIKILKEILE